MSTEEIKCCENCANHFQNGKKCISEEPCNGGSQWKPVKICSLPIVSARIDWSKLREKYFEECVNNGGYVKTSKIDMAPHDLFEWFKKELPQYVR